MTAARLTESQFEHYKEALNAEINPAMYISIDPGKSNGVCLYDEKFYLLAMITVHAEDINKFIHNLNHVKTCIIEDFKLYPNKSKEQQYSDMETSRVIGRVESWAEIKDVKLEKQPATIKTTAYLWLGQKPPKKSDPKNHMMDANAHFMYWAVSKGHVSARSLLK
jgi:hypothetical protein